MASKGVIGEWELNAITIEGLVEAIVPRVRGGYSNPAHQTVVGPPVGLTGGPRRYRTVCRRGRAPPAHQ